MEDGWTDRSAADVALLLEQVKELLLMRRQLGLRSIAATLGVTRCFAEDLLEHLVQQRLARRTNRKGAVYAQMSPA